MILIDWISRLLGFANICCAVRAVCATWRQWRYVVFDSRFGCDFLGVFNRRHISAAVAAFCGRLCLDSTAVLQGFCLIYDTTLHGC